MNFEKILSNFENGMQYGQHRGKVSLLNFYLELYTMD